MSIYDIWLAWWAQNSDHGWISYRLFPIVIFDANIQWQGEKKKSKAICFVIILAKVPTTNFKRNEALGICEFHKLNLLYFSPMCLKLIFKCFLRLFAHEDALSHDAFVKLFPTIRFQMRPKIACLRMQSHIGFICLPFLHCAFLNVSSNCLPGRMQSHIGCICLVFIQCALSNGPLQRMHSPIGCICLTFLHCAFSNVSSSRLPEWMHHHTDCICVTFLNLPAWEEA